MHWIKKTVFVMVSMFILFTIIQIFGAGLFSVEFLGVGGLILLLTLGIFEVNIVTYS